MAYFPTQIKADDVTMKVLKMSRELRDWGLMAYSYKHADKTGNDWDPCLLVGPTSHTLGVLASMGPALGV